MKKQTINIYSDELNHMLYADAEEELDLFINREIATAQMDDINIRCTKKIELTYGDKEHPSTELVDYDKNTIASRAKELEELQFKVRLTITIEQDDSIMYDPSESLISRIEGKLTQLSQVRNMQSFMEDHDNNKVVCQSCGWEGYHVELYDIEGDDMGESYECPECHSHDITYKRNSQQTIN